MGGVGRFHTKRIEPSLEQIWDPLNSTENSFIAMVTHPNTIQVRVMESIYNCRRKQLVVEIPFLAWSSTFPHPAPGHEPKNGGLQVPRNTPKTEGRECTKDRG